VIRQQAKKDGRSNSYWLYYLPISVFIRLSTLRWARKMGSLLISIIIAGFLAYSVLALTIYFMQPTFLYRPMRGILYTPAELGLDFDDVIFTSGDGVQLNGWYIPAEGSGMTVLFCHGNGGNMTHRLDSISIFNDLGLNCFIFDYRGYGNSEGEPSEEGTYMDAAAAYKWLREEKKQSAEDIIIFGRSLGGSIAAKLASSVKAKSLILESCFTSYVAIGAKFYPYMPVKWFARYNYNTVEYIQDVRCPVMVIHSRTACIMMVFWLRDRFIKRRGGIGWNS
jgi:fermentation-respiration switch protein FrsA (DUF1100 family)